jgi:hypothetical protein
LAESRRLIEAKLGRPAEFFSYPNGDVDERTLAGVRRHYRAAVNPSSTTRRDPHLMPNRHLQRGTERLRARHADARRGPGCRRRADRRKSAINATN